jgi:hypothetical protein
VGHHNLGKVCYRKWHQSRDRKWRHNRKWLVFFLL